MFLTKKNIWVFDSGFKSNSSFSLGKLLIIQTKLVIGLVVSVVKYGPLLLCAELLCSNLVRYGCYKAYSAESLLTGDNWSNPCIKDNNS